jgi:uncharacterized protein (TIGR02145 family)
MDQNSWHNSFIDKNISGFSSLPSGFRYWDGKFTGYGDLCHWWLSSELHETYANTFGLYVTSRRVQLFSHPKNEGMSVRCIKDRY